MYLSCLGHTIVVHLVEAYVEHDKWNSVSNYLTKLHHDMTSKLAIPYILEDLSKSSLTISTIHRRVCCTCRPDTPALLATGRNFLKLHKLEFDQHQVYIFGYI